MATSLLMAWSSPRSDEVDAAYSDWYQNVHVPEVRRALPAVTEVHRYRLSDLDPNAVPGKPRYLAVYEIDDPDVATAATTLRRALKTMTPTDTMDTSDHPPVLYWLNHV